jgi:DNA-binding transcriptional LysR family regulator
MDVNRRRAPPWQRSPRWTKEGLPFDLRRLRYVLAAADHLSFRRAAESLGMRSSSVSRGVRDFEDEVGVSLFERGTSGVRLTEAGARFLDEVTPALRQIEAALRTAGAAGRVEIGTVRVGVLTSLGGGFLRRLLTAFCEQHPDVTLEIHDGGRRDHLAAIRARRLDVAFLSGTASPADCETAELWCEHVHVALSSRHRLAPRRRLDWPDMREECFIVSMHDPGPEVRDYIANRAAEHGICLHVEHRPCSQYTLMNLVALGQGITLVAAGWSEVKVPGLAVRPLSDLKDVVPFTAVWSPGNDNPALRRFISVAHALAGRPRHGGPAAGRAGPDGADTHASRPAP